MAYTGSSSVLQCARFSMWIPKTEDEIVQAITLGSLVESPTFDAKREIPASGKSKDLAKDVAAMATDGGTLLYGIAEDVTGRPTVPAPFPLVGVAERVASIVRSGISEPPEIFVLTIPTAADSTVGYLVVSVPPSPRAPHMVTIDKDFRYYGRGANGNVILTEGEIARLYERRKRWETDQNAILSRSQMLNRCGVHSSDDSIEAFNRPRQEAPHPIQSKAPTCHSPWPPPRELQE